MTYSVAVLVAPAVEPVSRAEMKTHLKVDLSTEDGLIDALTVAAREWVENYTRRSLVKRTLELRLDCFPGEIKLPRGPVQSVSSVKYTDQDGTLQTVDAGNYQTDLYSAPARITPVFGGVWPTPKFGALNAVLVTYVAGYADDGGSPTDLASGIPSAIKAAIKLLVGHWFQNRDSAGQVPDAVKALLAPFEIRDYSLE